jgi:hypothetical protein
MSRASKYVKVEKKTIQNGGPIQDGVKSTPKLNHQISK